MSLCLYFHFIFPSEDVISRFQYLTEDSKLQHLQEKPLVLSAVDLLRGFNEFFGGVHGLTAGQQLFVQRLQLPLLLLLQARRPLAVPLRQRLQHIVVVLLQVLLSPAKILLITRIIYDHDRAVKDKTKGGKKSGKTT